MVEFSAGGSQEPLNKVAFQSQGGFDPAPQIGRRQALENGVAGRLMNMNQDPAMNGAFLTERHEGHACGWSGQSMERIGQEQIFIGGDGVLQ